MKQRKNILTLLYVLVGNLATMESIVWLRCVIFVTYLYNCPKSADTWCQYQKDKQDNTIYFKSKGDLPIVVKKAILPIYQSLCKSEMLEKCLHGKTQNAGESFNGTIWNPFAKATHIGLHVLSVGVYDSLAHFNNGEKISCPYFQAI